MDLYTEGLRQAVKEYGYSAMARALRMDESRLHKKLDPDGSINLTLADFFRISEILRDVRCVQPLLDEFGMVAIPRRAADGDTSLCDLILEKQVAIGHVAETVRAALEDGRIEAFEQVAIDKAVNKAIHALCALRLELGAMVEK